MQQVNFKAFIPVSADLWRGAWRSSQRSYWLQALCEWPSRNECTELVSSPIASAAEPCWLLPAAEAGHRTEVNKY